MLEAAQRGSQESPPAYVHGGVRDYVRGAVGNMVGTAKNIWKGRKSAGRIRMHPKTLRRSWISLMVRLRRIHFLLLMSNQPLARYDSQHIISGHKIVYAILLTMCGEPLKAPLYHHATTSRHHG